MSRTLRAEHQKLELTNEAVSALPLAADGRGYIARDTKLKGFRCIVSQNKKLLVFQAERREPEGTRRVIYKRLGDPEHVNVDEARARAHEELARLTRIKDPDAKAGITLADAWGAPADDNSKPDPDGYYARLIKANRSPATLDDYTQKYDRYLGPTFGKSALKDISRADVKRWHGKITEDHGPYVANGAARIGHALYQHALLEMEVPGLQPINPFRNRGLFNKEASRQTGMAERELPAWFKQVIALDNPVMREVNIMALLTGLRRTVLLSMRWADVGKDRIVIPYESSQIPITKAIRRSLDRLKLAGRMLPDRCREWVFPSITSKSGHVEEPKNDKLDKSLHALRHTFRGMCAGAKVPKLHSKLLMLHSVGQDVHDSYASDDALFDQLREANEKVSNYILRHLPKNAERDLERLVRENATACKRDAA